MEHFLVMKGSLSFHFKPLTILLQKASQNEEHQTTDKMKTDGVKRGGDFPTAMLDKSFVQNTHRDGARWIPHPQQTVRQYQFNQKEAEVYPLTHAPDTI